MDFEKEINYNVVKDDTKTRILGTKLEAEMKNTNSIYGTFNTDYEKYQRIGVKDRIFQDFFK